MDFQKDKSGIADVAVTNLAEVGLKETVQALTSLTGIPFRIGHSSTASFDKVSELDHSEDVSVGIYMAVDGDVPGHMGSLCSWDSACMMWTALLGSAPEKPDLISELDASMLLEVGNIMKAAFLRAVEEQFGVQLLATPPAVGVDMTSAILSSIVSGAADSESHAISIRNTIATDNGEAEWVFLFIAEAEDLHRLFGQFGQRGVA